MPSRFLILSEQAHEDLRHVATLGRHTDNPSGDLLNPDNFEPLLTLSLHDKSQEVRGKALLKVCQIWNVLEKSNNRSARAEFVSKLAPLLSLAEHPNGYIATTAWIEAIVCLATSSIALAELREMLLHPIRNIKHENHQDEGDAAG